ncbi:MAG: hypothetical protein HYY25_12590 [Candidatus Wallbacteria bacterium]|nr:hypothetical protein [Candidatus Wallbacteria bacterium]
MIAGSRLELWLLGGTLTTRKLSKWRALATLVVTGSPSQPAIEEAGGLEGLVRDVTKVLAGALRGEISRTDTAAGASLRARAEDDSDTAAVTAQAHALHAPLEPAVTIDVRVFSPRGRPCAAARAKALAIALETELRQRLTVARMEYRELEFTRSQVRGAVSANEVAEDSSPLFGLAAHAVASLRAMEGMSAVPVADDAAGGTFEGAGPAGPGDDSGGGSLDGGADDGAGGQL